MSEDIRHFADELHLLTARLREMGVAAEAQVSRSMRGLVEADRALLQQVIAGDESINRLHLEIDDRAFKLLALFQPVAVDLRSIVSAVKINSDLEDGDGGISPGRGPLCLARAGVRWSTCRRWRSCGVDAASGAEAFVSRRSSRSPCWPRTTSSQPEGPGSSAILPRS